MDVPSFSFPLRMSDIPLYRYPTHVCSFICQRTLGFFHLLAVVKDAAVNMVVKYLSDFLLSVLLDTCPEVRLLGRSVMLCQFPGSSVQRPATEAAACFFSHQQCPRAPVSSRADVCHVPGF